MRNSFALLTGQVRLLARVTFLFFVTLFLAGAGYSQNSSLGPLSEVPVLELPGLDNTELVSRDEKAARTTGPFQFAEPHSTKVLPGKSGRWETLKSGVTVWRQRIRSEGAVSLNLGFTRFHLPEGASLLLYTPDFSTLFGPFTAEDNESHGEFWSPVLPGDEVVVEVTLLAGTESQLSLEIGQVNHGYRTFGGNGEKSGSCNVDIACATAEEWRDQARSVGVYSISGVFTCSGALINNTRQDRKAYFLTANHCNVNESNDASVVVYWNYEHPTCREVGSATSGGAGGGTLDRFNSGSILRASYSPSDFILLELDDPIEPEVNPFWSGWNRQYLDFPSVVTIHHPDSDEKRISFEFDPTTTTSYLQTAIPGNGTHIRVADWDIGTTEPGSSGSPLYSPQKLIVGQLHGGFAACGNNLSDWYGRMSVSWEGGGAANNRLKDWLDPLGTQAEFLAGVNLSPSFTLAVAQSQASACRPDSTTFDIGIGSILGFSDQVTLSVPDLPNGLTASFSQNPVPPDSQSLLTLSGTANVDPGEYHLTLLAESSASEPATRTQALTLNIFSGAPSSPALLSPANGAQEESLTPMLAWGDNGDAADFQIEVSSSPTFTGTVFTAVSSNTSYLLEYSLAPESTYYWRVVPSNDCGEGPASSVFSFTTANVFCSRPRLAIPDQGNGSRTDSVRIQQTGPIDDLIVGLKIEHSFVGDLNIVLRHEESGTQVTLIDRPLFPGSSFGCEGEDIDILLDDAASAAAESTCLGAIPTLAGSLRPNGALSVFEGEDVSGTWYLTITDMASGDVGVLEEWCLLPRGTFSAPPCESGLYVLDTYGGRHPVGTPPTITGEVYFGNDIARDLERFTCSIGGEEYRDLAVLDGFGGVHVVQSQECRIPQTFYFGDQAASFPQGRAVDLTMTVDGQGFWVLTDFGGIYRAGSAKGESDPAEVPGTADLGMLGFDIPLTGELRDPDLPEPGGASLRAVSLVVIDRDLDSRAEGYVIVDSMGGRIHLDSLGDSVAPGEFSTAPENDPTKILDPIGYVWPFFAGLDIVRDAELTSDQRGLVILDGWDGIHPVPVDKESNPVFFAKNIQSQGNPFPAQSVGLPYVPAGFDNPDTEEVDEGDPSVFGIDAGSIFVDLEFSAGCEGGLYTLDRFGGIFVLGAGRDDATDLAPPFEGAPYFYPAQRAIDMEIFGVGETETPFSTGE